MLRALYTSASGMNAQQMNLDVIANNLANVNTTGFKKSKIEFADLLYQTRKPQGGQAGDGNITPSGIQIGHGARPVATTKVFTVGELVETGEDMDVAIAGDGFFEVQMPGGVSAYTRAGSFKLSATGEVVTTEGFPLLGGFPVINPEVTNVVIAANGDVSTFTQEGEATLAGTIQLTRFPNPGGLQSIGSTLLIETDASGAPEVGAPGENGFGQMAQGYIETSNVKVVEEMVNLIKAQRAYEINSKAIQAADDMMQRSNNLKR